MFPDQLSHASWDIIMERVEAIEEMGYTVLIGKYSCSIRDIKTNMVVVENTNPFRLRSKKEAVARAIIKFNQVSKCPNCTNGLEDRGNGDVRDCSTCNGSGKIEITDQTLSTKNKKAA